MKRQSLIIALILGALALPQIGSAQTNVLKAYNDFKTNHSTYIVNITNENGQRSTYETLSFKLPKEQSALLSKLQQAFDKDKPSAYELLQQKASVNPDEKVKFRYKKGFMVYENQKTGKTVQVTTQTKRVTTDDELKNSVRFGNDIYKNYIVLLTRDKADSLYRRAVALEWMEKGGLLVGKLYNIYSRDPRTVKKENRNIITTFNADGSIKRYNSDTNTTHTYQHSGVTADDYKLASANNSTEFLSKFGNLRAAYIDSNVEIKELSYRTSLANQILLLCKNSGSVLSSDERQICIKAIEEMRGKSLDDSYITSLLSLAAKNLEK